MVSLDYKDALLLGSVRCEIARNKREKSNPSRAVLGDRIPLPSLPEQRRIVARIEKLAAKINEARGLRHRTLEELELVVKSKATKLFAVLMDGPRKAIQLLGEQGSNP
jgi:hypothetical protein